MGATSSSDNPYGYRNGGNGLTAPIQYPNRFTARNDITGDAIRSGYSELYAENLVKIKKTREEEVLPNDYVEDKFPVFSECEKCSVVFSGNSSRGICKCCTTK